MSKDYNLIPFVSGLVENKEEFTVSKFTNIKNFYIITI